MKKKNFILALLMGVAHSVLPLAPNLIFERVNLDSKCSQYTRKYPTLDRLKTNQNYVEKALDIINLKIHEKIGKTVDILNLNPFLYFQDIISQNELVEIVKDTMNIMKYSIGMEDFQISHVAYYLNDYKYPLYAIQGLQKSIKTDIPEKIELEKKRIQSQCNSLKIDFNILETIFNAFLEMPIIKFYSDLERELGESDAIFNKNFRKTFLSKIKNLLSASKYTLNLIKEYAEKDKNIDFFVDNLNHNFYLIRLKICEAIRDQNNEEVFDYYYIKSILQDKENTGNINHYFEDSKIKKIIKKWKLAKEARLAEEQMEERMNN